MSIRPWWRHFSHRRRAGMGLARCARFQREHQSARPRAWSRGSDLAARSQDPALSGARIRRTCRYIAEEVEYRARMLLTGNGATELAAFLCSGARPGGVALVVPAFSEFHRAFPKAAFAHWDDVEAWPTSGFVGDHQSEQSFGRPGAHGLRGLAALHVAHRDGGRVVSLISQTRRR